MTTEQSFSLAAEKCSCKAKTALVRNFEPQPAHILTLEESTFGLASLTAETVQLGLVVHGPLQLFTDLHNEPEEGPRTFFGSPTWKDYGGRITWARTLGKGKFGVVFKKANDAAHLLLNTLKISTVSVRARAIFYSTYCLSKFTYVATYNVVSPQDIHNLQVRVARAVLHRHWLQARHLPGVLRCLRIAPMQDIEIAFACAAVGLLERRAATDLQLRQYLCSPQPEYRCDRQLETAITYLERYLPSLPHRNVTAIQHALKNSCQWADYTRSPEVLQLSTRLGDPSNEASPRQSDLPVSNNQHRSTSLGLVKHFKLGMKISREEAAMEYLRERTITSWSAAPSYMWLQALTKLAASAPLWCHSKVRCLAMGSLR